MWKPSSFAVAFLAVCIGPAAACLWDADTLQMERQRFPNVLELITGKFPRHSPEFYEWRIRDREEKLRTGPPRAEHIDDLSVAYDKLGKHEIAIQTARDQQQQFPGRYETHANLATFYVHAGQLELALKETERALAINPNAHFGREVYQAHLVRYLIARTGTGKLQLPLNATPRTHAPGGFAAYLIAETMKDFSEEERSGELQAATKGVLGMLRFANFESPILLEAIGDLLLGHRYPNYDPMNARALSARAYLKASYHAPDEVAQRAYRDLARQSLAMLEGVKRGDEDETLNVIVEQPFIREIADAKKWYASVRDDELAWIAQGLDADIEFGKKYYVDPVLEGLEPPSSQSRSRTEAMSVNPWYVAGWVLVALCIVGVVVLSKRYRRTTETTSDTKSNR